MDQNLMQWYRALRSVGKSAREAHNIAKRMAAQFDFATTAHACGQSFDYVLRTARVYFPKP